MTNYISVSSIPWYNNRNAIKNVVIENGVTSIGNYAFYYCFNLRSVTIGDSVKSIGIVLLYADCTFDHGVYVLTLLDGYAPSASPLIAEMEGAYRLYLN